jgi:hypothetical protein
MAKSKKRAAMRKKTKLGKASVRHARKATAKRAAMKQTKAKPRRVSKRTRKPAVDGIDPVREVVLEKTTESVAAIDEATPAPVATAEVIQVPARPPTEHDRESSASPSSDFEASKDGALPQQKVA